MNVPGIQQRLQQFRSRCHERGLPLAFQRRDVLKAVLERDDQTSLDQIFAAVKDRLPGPFHTTVYRVLDTLVALGFIRRLHQTGTSARPDGKTHRHHDLTRKKSSRVIDVESKELDDLRLPHRQRFGFEIEGNSVRFMGVCKLRCGNPSE